MQSIRLNCRLTRMHLYLSGECAHFIWAAPMKPLVPRLSPTELVRVLMLLIGFEFDDIQIQVVVGIVARNLLKASISEKRSFWETVILFVRIKCFIQL